MFPENSHQFHNFNKKNQICFVNTFSNVLRTATYNFASLHYLLDINNDKKSTETTKNSNKYT